VILRFSTELYPKSALVKAAYHFTPDAYVHLDIDEKNYLVELSPKGNLPLPPGLEKQFINEILAQTVRHHVSTQTGHLRELIMARAFASTIIEPSAECPIQGKESDPSLEEILVDWFELNDERI